MDACQVVNSVLTLVPAGSLEEGHDYVVGSVYEAQAVCYISSRTFNVMTPPSVRTREYLKCLEGIVVIVSTVCLFALPL